MTVEEMLFKIYNLSNIVIGLLSCRHGSNESLLSDDGYLYYCKDSDQVQQQSG